MPPQDTLEGLVTQIEAKLFGNRPNTIPPPCMAFVFGLDRGAEIANRVYLGAEFTDLDSEEAKQSLAAFKAACLEVYKSERGPNAKTLLAPTFGEENVNDFVENSHYDGVCKAIKTVWAARVYRRPTTE